MSNTTLASIGRHPVTADECAHAAALDLDVHVTVITMTWPASGRVVAPAWKGRVQVWLDGADRSINVSTDDVSVRC